MTFKFIPVGNTEFLKDKDFSVPEAKTTTVTNVSDDSLTVSTKTLRSGKYGNWNEFKSPTGNLSLFITSLGKVFSISPSELYY